MKKAILLSTALTLGSMTNAWAGGLGEPVTEETVIVEQTASSSAGGIVVPLLILLVIAAAASGSSGGGGGPVMFSDIRLKENIVRVGTNHLGLGVYQYNYKGLDGVFEGVMAQEVEVMHPGAVHRLPFGYKAVDYASIGLAMRRIH